MGQINVYSTRVVGLKGLTGSATYTVPNGLVFILRDVDAYSTAGISSANHITLEGAAGQAIWWHEFPADQTSIGQFRGRQVLFEGETLTVIADGSVDVTVSGYLLISP